MVAGKIVPLLVLLHPVLPSLQPFLSLISFTGCVNQLQVKTTSFSLMKIMLLSQKAAKFHLTKVKGRCFSIPETGSFPLETLKLSVD